MEYRIVLLIETSTERGMTAFIQDGQVIYQGELPPGYQNSKFLLPAIEKGLTDLKISPKDLQYIAVGIGPGSYTGIRVGVAAAKGLAFACDLPLIGICSLQTFVPKKEGSFAVLIDAKIGGAYLILGILTEGQVSYLTVPEVVALENLGERLQGIKRIVTPQTLPLRTKIEALYPSLPWEWEEEGPDPLHMGCLAEENFKTGQFTREGHLPLLYLRKTQAEIEKEQN